MKHVALFAGLGGFMQATNNLGIDTVWANEIDSNCCEVLRENFNESVIVEKSVTDINEVDLSALDANIDLLTAGFPCQSFSQASGGEIKGFKDERGQLFFEIPRIIALMKKPPKVVLLENVPTLKIFDKGSILKTVMNKMRFAGYWVSEKNTKILSAAEYGGSPQRRERLFVVCAHKDVFTNNPFDFSSLKKTPKTDVFQIVNREKRVSDRHYLDKDNKYYKMIENLSKKQGKERLFQIRRVEARACPPGTCPTLTANMGGGGHNVPFVFDDFGLRKLTVEECLKLQGFDTSKFIIPDNMIAKDILTMIGNAVHVELIRNIIQAIQEAFFNKSTEGKLV
jgi:DNA (cytosine-5)-methyltransferase 1